MFAVKRELLKQALEDPETNRKLREAESLAHVKRVLVEFAKKHGYKVVEWER